MRRAMEMLAVVVTACVLAMLGSTTAEASSRGEVQQFAFAVDMPQAAAFDPAVAERAYSKLRREARAACRQHGIRSLSARTMERACARDLVNQVVAQSQSQLLASLHAPNAVPRSERHRSGRAPPGLRRPVARPGAASQLVGLAVYRKSGQPPGASLARSASSSAALA